MKKYAWYCIGCGVRVHGVGEAVEKEKRGEKVECKKTRCRGKGLELRVEGKVFEIDVGLNRENIR